MNEKIPRFFVRQVRKLVSPNKMTTETGTKIINTTYCATQKIHLLVHNASLIYMVSEKR